MNAILWMHCYECDVFNLKLWIKCYEYNTMNLTYTKDIMNAMSDSMIM